MLSQPASQLKPGMTLARSHAAYLGIEPGEIIDQRTKTEVLRFIHRTAGRFLLSRHIEIRGLKAVIGPIVEDAVDNRHILAHLSSLRIHDSYTFSHSLNVCLLSILIGAKMRLPAGQLSELAVGALLHDLGKTIIPPEILNKPGTLSADEWQTVRRHGDEAFRILRSQWALPLSAAHIACQHHENYDGSGYPRGLVGDQIHLFARIVAVADNFDAVTSDRPYRGAYQPHEAYELILWSRGTKLDPAIVDILLDTVAIFPAGPTVALGGGETGIVIGPFPGPSDRPAARIAGNPDGACGAGQLADLAGELTQMIVRVVKVGAVTVSAV